MNFSTHTSHNRYDTTVFRPKDGRIEINVRVDLRISKLLDILASRKTHRFTDCGDARRSMNKKFEGACYTASDMKHALKRMQEAGLVSKSGPEWHMTPKAKQIWNSIEKKL